MVLLCGIPSETPLALVRAELDRMQVPCVVFNQRSVARTEIAFAVDGNGPRGELAIEGAVHALEGFTGLYTRLMDHAHLPELRDEPPGSVAHLHARAVHELLWRWCQVAPGRVVNRPGNQSSNGSKPLQAQLIREAGFAVPETLVTNDPELVQDFQARHGRVVYKSMSSVRSVVSELDAEALERLEHIRWCPTQFQAWVPGDDVRVHTVGSKTLFASRIRSEATDYRYARAAGHDADLEPLDLDNDVAERCLALAASLGLEVAGIDLRMRPDGSVVCFEVNPSPAFSYYELSTGQPIARAIARHLAGLGPA